MQKAIRFDGRVYSVTDALTYDEILHFMHAIDVPADESAERGYIVDGRFVRHPN